MNVRQPLVCQDRQGRRNVFALGPAGELLRRTRVGDRGNWTEWQSLGGLLKSYVLIADAAGAIHALGVGGDDAVWTCAQPADGDAFSPWRSLGGRVRCLRAARNRDGRLELFACGTDDALWNNWQLAPGGDWCGWATLGGRIANLHVEADADQRLHVFGIGGDAAVWHIHQTAPGERYGPWKSLGGRVLDLASGDGRDGRLEVFGIGTDRALWLLQQQSPGGPWGAWQKLGGIVKDIAVASGLDGRLEVFGIGDDDAVWNLAQVAANGAWGSWQSLGCPARHVYAAGDERGQVTAYAVGLDGALYSATQPDPARDEWTPFARFPQNPALGSTGAVAGAATATFAATTTFTAAPAGAFTVASGGGAEGPSTTTTTMTTSANDAPAVVSVVAVRPLEALAPGQTFARDFRVDRLLGRGGMGAVYVVEQVSTGEQRALKLMLPALLEDPRNRERFVGEAKVPSRIESDHVVETVAAGVDEASDTPWLAMELLRGESLADAVARSGALPRSRARELFAQLGHALGAAHSAGVVHRDLKPENLYLCQSRHRGVPFTLKVLDFGIAALVSDTRDAAKVTTAVGSPLWMAPEQATVGAAIVPATDVWAVGLIAFFALSGKEFWLAAHDDTQGLMGLMREIFIDPIPRASERAAVYDLAGTLPAGFDDWFARCVSRETASRFADGAECAAALDRVLAAG